VVAAYAALGISGMLAAIKVYETVNGWRAARSAAALASRPDIELRIVAIHPEAYDRATCLVEAHNLGQGVAPTRSRDRSCSGRAAARAGIAS
jgi:hypothetical protein